jgi:hypothetical protein
VICAPLVGVVYATGCYAGIRRSENVQRGGVPSSVNARAVFEPCQRRNVILDGSTKRSVRRTCHTKLPPGLLHYIDIKAVFQVLTATSVEKTILHGAASQKTAVFR